MRAPHRSVHKALGWSRVYRIFQVPAASFPSRPPYPYIYENGNLWLGGDSAFFDIGTQHRRCIFRQGQDALLGAFPTQQYLRRPLELKISDVKAGGLRNARPSPGRVTVRDHAVPAACFDRAQRGWFRGPVGECNPRFFFFRRAPWQSGFRHAR